MRACAQRPRQAIGRIGALPFNFLNALGGAINCRWHGHSARRSVLEAQPGWMRRWVCRTGRRAPNDQGLRTLVESTPIGEWHPVKRLVVVAEDSLIVEAIAIALRKSGEFNLLGHLDPRSASVEKIVDAAPDVVLIDEMDQSDRAVELIQQIRAERDSVAVIVLTLAPASARLDEIFEAGAVAAVSKATNPAALATLIRETLDGRMLHVYKPVGRVQGSPGKSAAAEESVLSARELEVLRLVAAGSTNSEIARKLWVTEQTVKFHLSNIYRKLEVGNRTEASHYAHVNGLLSGGEAVAS